MASASAFLTITCCVPQPPTIAANTMHCISRWNANHLSYHLAFASFKLGAVLIKLAGFLANRGRSTPERERLRTDNYGTQLLATMLGLPLDSTPIVEWQQLIT